MKKNFSYTRAEHQVLHKFRQNLNLAESDEDVKKFFVYAARDLIQKVTNNLVHAEFDDIQLTPEHENGFSLSNTLKKHPVLLKTLSNSDMTRILKNLAATAFRHCRSSRHNADKSETKVNPMPSHAGRRRFINQTAIFR